MRRVALRLLCALVFITSATFSADSLFAQIAQFVSPNPQGEASVTFQIVGDELHVHLANSSTKDSKVPTDLLTGVYFDLPGNPTLKPISAFISPGSTMVNGSAPGGNVGGEWAFCTDLTGALNGARYGLSTSGLGMFGPSDIFPGPNLSGKAGVQGMDYALLSAGDDPTTGNAALFRNPLIHNAVDFVLQIVPQSFSLNAIDNLSVQYGTSTSEPRFEITPIQTPEPTSAAAIGAVSFGLLLRRRRQA